jgi:hypothetical protein
LAAIRPSCSIEERISSFKVHGLQQPAMVAGWESPGLGSGIAESAWPCKVPASESLVSGEWGSTLASYWREVASGSMAARGVAESTLNFN